MPLLRLGRYGTDPSLAWEADYIMGPDATNYELLQSGGPSGDMKLGTAPVTTHTLFFCGAAR
jgi:hypothetical protein